MWVEEGLSDNLPLSLQYISNTIFPLNYDGSQFKCLSEH